MTFCRVAVPAPFLTVTRILMVLPTVTLSELSIRCTNISGFDIVSDAVVDSDSSFAEAGATDKANHKSAIVTLFMFSPIRLVAAIHGFDLGWC